jgi:AFG3 family protein
MSDNTQDLNSGETPQNETKTEDKNTKKEKPKRKSPFGENSSGQKPKFNAYWIYLVIAIVILSMQFLNPGSGPKDTSWKELREMILASDVDKIVVVNEKA